MSPGAHLEVVAKDGSVETFSRTFHSSTPTSHDVPAGHEWPMELEQTRPDWTEAFKGMPLRNTEGQPLKLVDIRSGTVEFPKQPVRYAAVSYAWAEWEKVEDILCRLRSLMEQAGLVYCWIDQLCIDQESEREKAAEIKRMREYYATAAITYVMVPRWSTTFVWELAGFSMSYEQAALASMEVKALQTTKWASRVWTMQEASLSGRTVYVGGSVVKSAVELAVASTLKWLGSSVGQLNHAVWHHREEKGDSYVTVVQENDGGSTSSFVAATHLLRDRVILTNTSYAKTEYDYLDDVWRMSGARQCKEEEDRVYGMLGLVRGGEKVTVEYNIGFEEAVRKAAAEGLVSSGVLLAETISQRPGRWWCPAPGTESRFKDSKRRKWDETTQMQPLQLTTEGLCMVRAAKFHMPGKPQIRGKNTTSWISDESGERAPRFYCKNFEGGRDFELDFDCGFPEGEEWRGDWLAVVEIQHGRWPDRATLIKYKLTEGERMYKLRALEADIGFLDNEYVGEFQLG